MTNTNWQLVSRLHVADDRSRDGTYEFLSAAMREVPVPVTLTQSKFDGSVNALLHTLPRVKAEFIAKIDNDLIVCPEWLDAMTKTLASAPNIDALGMEPGFAESYEGQIRKPWEYGVQPARWIGGIGLFRMSLFRRQQPRQNDRFFGMTAFWKQHARCGWVSPDLPVFLLDKLPFEPWRSLTAMYVERGWSRAWPDELLYPEEKRDYFAWWVKSQTAVS